MNKLLLLLLSVSLTQAAEQPTNPRNKVTYRPRLAAFAEEEEEDLGFNVAIEFDEDAELLSLATTAHHNDPAHEMSSSCPPAIERYPSPEITAIPEQVEFFKMAHPLHEAAKPLIVTGKDLVFFDHNNQPLRGISSISQFIELLKKCFTPEAQKKAFQSTLFAFKARHGHIISTFLEQFHRYTQQRSDISDRQKAAVHATALAHSINIKLFIEFLKNQNCLNQFILQQRRQTYQFARSASAPTVQLQAPVRGKAAVTPPKKSLSFSPESETALYCLNLEELNAMHDHSSKSPERQKSVQQTLARKMLCTEETPELAALYVGIVPTKTYSGKVEIIEGGTEV